VSWWRHQKISEKDNVPPPLPKGKGRESVLAQKKPESPTLLQKFQLKKVKGANPP